MCEIVSCSISLYGQLKFSYYLVADYDFQCYIADRSFIVEPTLDFVDHESIVLLDKSLN